MPDMLTVNQPRRDDVTNLYGQKITREPGMCSEDVPDGGRGVGFHPCRKKGVVERGGKLYCKVHDPEAASERLRLARERDDANWAKRRVELAAPDLLAACKALIEGKVEEFPDAVHPSGKFCNTCGCNSKERVHVPGCPVELAEQAIKKAEGDHVINPPGGPCAHCGRHTVYAFRNGEWWCEDDAGHAGWEAPNA